MSDDSIDADGYRANVGIIIINEQRQVLWARRVGQRGWQFPQGGIRPGESPEEAMYRELEEEVGLRPGDVDVVAITRDWCRYELPERFVRRHVTPVCIGQKQLWFMLRLTASEARIRMDTNDQPEFDHWEWVAPDVPLKHVIYFKKDVYAQVLSEFRPYLDNVDVRLQSR
ncbi:MAG: RNA pyrophosphohydrolase [Pseudomonadota bacterium]